jgi:CheY-like chemotaxis protein
MSPPRALVADDNPLSLQFLAEALAACGMECVGASDGMEALGHASERAFDLLLLDARMPRLDGASTLARVRAQAGPCRHAIALATTADTMDATRVALLDAGFTEVLIKPFGIETLRSALVRSAIPCASAGDAAGPSLLDDDRALATAGGDAAIADALRMLFVQELDALPAEIEAIGARADRAALCERLHRLDASAGFCGAPGLAVAASRLRARLEVPDWPDHAIDDLLAVAARVRAMLGR